MEKDEKRDYFKGLFEIYKFSRDRYWLLISSTVTLSSALLTFGSSSLLEKPYVRFKGFVYLGLFFASVAMVYGLYGLKKRIELEMNSSSGELNRLSGKELSVLQKKAIEESANTAGKTDYFADRLLALFVSALVSLALSFLPCPPFCLFSCH